MARLRASHNIPSRLDYSRTPVLTQDVQGLNFSDGIKVEMVMEDVPNLVDFRRRSDDHLGGIADVIVLVDADILGCDMPFERGAQRAQVQVTVDAAELGGGFDHAGGAPAQRHLSVSPALTLWEWSRQIPIKLSTQLVDRKDLARVGGTPRCSTVSVSSMPSRRDAAAPG